jgi:cation transport ATPase
MCQYTIEKDLAFEKGVKYALLDVDTKILTVAFKQKKTDPNKIRVRVTKVGYHADSLKRDPKAYEDLPNCCKDGAHGGGHNKEHEHHKN